MRWVSTGHCNEIIMRPLHLSVFYFYFYFDVISFLEARKDIQTMLNQTQLKMQ